MLVVHRGDGRQIQIGQPCSWANEPPVPSPDGSYLAAWRPRDGAASSMHLISLTGTPTDTGEVPRSVSANYSATWTSDGRVWFTHDGADGGSEDMNGLLSFVPGASASQFTPVRANILVMGVRALLDA
jgi:hypothetical protein